MNVMTKISLEQRDYSNAAKKALSRAPALFIGNEWVASSAGAMIPVIDPSNGREVSRIVDASDADVDRAVAAARTAFDDQRWSGLPPMVREATMNRLADLLEQHADEFAELKRSTMASQRAWRPQSTFPVRFRKFAIWRAG